LTDRSQVIDNLQFVEFPAHGRDKSELINRGLRGIFGRLFLDCGGKQRVDACAVNTQNKIQKAATGRRTPKMRTCEQ